MFSGIIEEVGIVKLLQAGKLTVSACEVLKGTRLGDSLAINGACLTVTDLSGSAFSVDIMPETLRRTNLGVLRPGDGVNLERALAVGGRFGGHFVQGHVDGTGRAISVVPEEEAAIMKVATSTEIMRYLVEKGFIAVDGVSLTITRCDATSFDISLVAYTQQHTTLGRRRAGDVVNLEVDILAKYMERLRGEWGVGGIKKEAASSRISSEFLAEHGFLAG